MATANHCWYCSGAGRLKEFRRATMPLRAPVLQDGRQSVQNGIPQIAVVL
jgi:hypothetical protein